MGRQNMDSNRKIEGEALITREWYDPEEKRIVYEVIAPLHRPKHPKSYEVREELAKDVIAKVNPRVAEEDIDTLDESYLGKTKYSNCEIIEYKMTVPDKLYSGPFPPTFEELMEKEDQRGR